MITPSSTPSTTVTEIIERAAMQLDGIGLEPSLIAEAITELERSLERHAAAALSKVLHRHIARLSPLKKTRKGTHSEPRTENETSE